MLYGIGSIRYVQARAVDGKIINARQINSLIEPKCIFRDEYQNYDKAGILAEIIRTSREAVTV